MSEFKLLLYLKIQVLTQYFHTSTPMTLMKFIFPIEFIKTNCFIYSINYLSIPVSNELLLLWRR